MKTKSYLAVAALLTASTMAFGQNFNPTVEVTNVYKEDPSSMRKPQMQMNVPDSLMRFNQGFDYTIFNKKYEGSYDFKPYMLNMKPEKDAFRGRKLHVSAGAGYTLHPSFDMVYSPLAKKAFQLNIYASHRSYWGDYADIVPQDADGILELRKSDNSWKGYQSLTSAGIEGRYNWEKTILTFGAGYYGLHASDTLCTRGFNALDFNARIRSNNSDEKYFFYDFDLAGRYGCDALDWKSLCDPYRPLNGNANLAEGLVRLKGSAGPVIDYFHRVIVGLDVVSATYSNLFESSSGLIALAPRYEFETGKWNFGLGIRIEALVGGKENGEEEGTEIFRTCFMKKSQYVYPAVDIAFKASENVVLYTAFTGGADMTSYSSMIAQNHHLTPVFQGMTSALLDNSIDKINGKIGIRGNLWKKLQFEIDGGASVVENGLLEGGWTVLGKMLPSVARQDYGLLYADMLMGLKSGKVRLDAGLHYRKMLLPQDQESMKGFEMPLLSGRISAIYDFNSRLYAGLALDAATAHEGRIEEYPFEDSPTLHPARIPGYLDLGLVAGYDITRKIGLWAKAGNLLAQTVQRNPFYAEKGVWGTLGLTVTL